MYFSLLSFLLFKKRKSNLLSSSSSYSWHLKTSPSSSWLLEESGTLKKERRKRKRERKKERGRWSEGWSERSASSYLSTRHNISSSVVVESGRSNSRETSDGAVASSYTDSVSSVEQIRVSFFNGKANEKFFKGNPHTQHYSYWLALALLTMTFTLCMLLYSALYFGYLFGGIKNVQVEHVRSRKASLLWRWSSSAQCIFFPKLVSGT